MPHHAEEAWRATSWLTQCNNCQSSVLWQDGDMAKCCTLVNQPSAMTYLRHSYLGPGLLGKVLLRPKGFPGLLRPGLLRPIQLRPVLFSRTDGDCSFSSFFCFLFCSFPFSLLLLLHSLLFRLALHLLIVLLLFLFFCFCPQTPEHLNTQTPKHLNT